VFFVFVAFVDSEEDGFLVGCLLDENEQIWGKEQFMRNRVFI
jgi:hypothetical protein